MDPRQVQTCDIEVSIDIYIYFVRPSNRYDTERVLTFKVTVEHVVSETLCHEPCLAYNKIKLFVSRGTTVRFPALHL
jgi:hypothetical protein